MNNLRIFHLRSALSTPSTIMWEGREHLVVPVVALQEAVIHAVNAKNAEKVLASALEASVERWAGHPLVVGHPVKEGRQISAHSADVLAKHGFGFIRQAAMNGNRLGMEVYVDPARLEALGQGQLLKDLRAGLPIEVSVGAFVTTNDRQGTHGGRVYHGEWTEINPDHLAFLPGGKGACSLEMGCGAHRAAEAYTFTDTGVEVTVLESKGAAMTLKERLLALFDAASPDAEADQAMRAAIGKVISSKNMTTIQSAHDAMAALGAQCGPTTAAKKECPTCDGTGQVTKDSQQQDCETCDGTGYMVKAAEAVALKAACSCQGDNMDKKARIADLLANEYNTVKTITEATSDDVLTVLEAQAETNKKHAADLKAAQDKADAADVALKAAQASQIPAEELAELRALATAQKDANAKKKTALLTVLKAAQTAYNEAELNGMDLTALEKLVEIAKVEVPADYSGKAIPVVRAAGAKDYTPPQPYPALAKKAAN